jgi:hypothetical protein
VGSPQALADLGVVEVEVLQDAVALDGADDVLGQAQPLGDRPRVHDHQEAWRAGILPTDRIWARSHARRT